MCGDPNSRTPTIDSGDLIAIIHPSSAYSCSFGGGRLHLSNKCAGTTVSNLSYREASPSSASASDSDSESSLTTDRLSVRIHRFGQPLLQKDAEKANPVMHEFAVDECRTRLDLGVGGDGVIGRTVSIIDGRRRVLGEGVIGWS